MTVTVTTTDPQRLDADEAPRPPSRSHIIAQARADLLADLAVTPTEAAVAWVLDVPVTAYIAARLIHQPP